MAQNAPQTYANHVRLHPPYHFFLFPGSVVLLILTIVNVVRHFQLLEAWVLLLIGILFPVAVLLLRLNALRVQDRVIRLEERLRMQSVLPDSLRPRIAELTASQIVALRFASDAELTGLVEKALSSKMGPADLKKAIVNWRPDTFRV